MQDTMQQAKSYLEHCSLKLGTILSWCRLMQMYQTWTLASYSSKILCKLLMPCYHSTSTALCLDLFRYVALSLIKANKGENDLTAEMYISCKLPCSHFFSS